MDDIADAGTPAPRKRRMPAAALVGAGLVAGAVLAGLTTANAQSGPTPSPSSAAGDQAPHDEQHRMKRGPGGHGLRGHGPRGPGMLGPGMPGPGGHLGRGVLHGEFTTKDPEGGYRTMAVQHGEATAVSATSITVRSEDGFSRTYAVTGDTQVDSADEGIGDVSTGDQVHVLAVVEGGTATAIHVSDQTELGRLRDKWHPRRAKPSAEPTPST